jgi:hypothetical protein
MADGRKRQVSGHQRLAVSRQFSQKTDPDAGSLLGVVFEAVVPVGVLAPGRNTVSPANVSWSSPDARRTTLSPGFGCD